MRFASACPMEYGHNSEPNYTPAHPVLCSMQATRCERSSSGTVESSDTPSHGLSAAGLKHVGANLWVSRSIARACKLRSLKLLKN